MLKDDFIRLAIEHQVLQFGDFKLKSGRRSPYFFNAGLFYTGSALKALGIAYADLLLAHHIPCHHLFGPAYKGLPLVTATAIALAQRGHEVLVSFNRKEIKDHGEGGQIIGAPLAGEIVLIDDVITAGTAFRESERLINQHQAEITTVLVALDRAETDILTQIRAQGIQVLSLISLDDLISYLDKNQPEQAEILSDYRTDVQLSLKK